MEVPIKRKETAAARERERIREIENIRGKRKPGGKGTSRGKKEIRERERKNPENFLTARN